MKTALTVAGFDPSGGAGIQADLKVFGALGLYGLSAVSALTAQNARAVRYVRPVAPDFLRKQLQVLLADFSPQAVKTGMLLTAENVAVVSSISKRHGLVNLVVDPVIQSSSGKSLANRDAVAAMKKRLLPLARVVTPNLYEASVLSGIPVRNRHDMETAAGILKKLGPQAVIITGGHLESEAADLVFDGSGIHYLRGAKAAGQYHGTGCTFSAALAAYLAEGRPVREAAASAKRFVKKAFGKYLEISGGMRLFHI